MNELKNKLKNRIRRKNRARAIVSGTAERPRLSVFISNRHVTAQLIDDTKHETIAYVTSVGKKNTPIPMSEKAKWVGSEIGKKAKQAKIRQVVFDRNGRLHHGRVKALADAARNQGLEF